MKILSSLRGIVCAVVKDWRLHDDCFQEVVRYYLEVTLEIPGQTESWYLQRCDWKLRSWLRQGVSIDSPKRRHLQCEVEHEEAEQCEPLARAESIVDACDLVWDD